MATNILNPISAIQHTNPYPYYAELTEKQPFYFDEKLMLWVASSATAVDMILDSSQMRVRPITQPIPTGLVNTCAGEIFGQLVRMQDGNYHHQLKPIIIQALSSIDPQYAQTLTTEITKVQLQLCTDINKLMFVIPAGVIAHLCGFVPQVVPEIIGLIAEFVLCIPATATIEHQQRANQAAKLLLSTFTKEITQAKQGSLLLELLQTAADEGWQSQAPLIANAIGFLSQTYDATAGLIGNTLLLAQRYPDLYRESLTSFVREVSRFDAPIQNTRRFAAESFYYNNNYIEQGQTVLLLLAAANRDPVSICSPHEFLLDRSQEQSFTFSKGTHLCPGADLARIITCGVLDALQQFQPVWIKKLSCRRYLPSGNARIPEFTL